MIILDTHIWVWWVDHSPRLTTRLHELIELHQPNGLGGSIFSCWEVAKLLEKGRMELIGSVSELAGCRTLLSWGAIAGFDSADCGESDLTRRVSQ